MDSIPFIREFVQRLRAVGPNGTQVGVVQYTGKQRTEFSLNEYRTRWMLLGHVDRLMYLRGVTFTGAAMLYALAHEFRTEKGDRSEAKNILLVITDGFSQDQVEGPAEKVAQQGIATFAVGVTEKFHFNQLFNITNRKADHVILATKKNSTAAADFLVSQLEEMCGDQIQYSLE